MAPIEVTDRLEELIATIPTLEAPSYTFFQALS